jgi:hypothetical protein
MASTTTVDVTSDCDWVAGIVGQAVIVANVSSGDSWQLVAHAEGRALTLLDDHRTVVLADHDATGRPAPRGYFHVWRLPPDGSPEAWVRSATNAIAPTSVRGTIGWRALPAR